MPSFPRIKGNDPGRSWESSGGFQRLGNRQVRKRPSVLTTSQVDKSSGHTVWWLQMTVMNQTFPMVYVCLHASVRVCVCVSASSKFNWGCLNECEWEVIYWTMGNLTAATPLKKTTPFYHSLSIVLQGGVEPMRLFPSPWWNIYQLDRRSVFMSKIVMPSSEVSFMVFLPYLWLWHPSYLPHRNVPWALQRGGVCVWGGS